jgi:hypothetical protein
MADVVVALGVLAFFGLSMLYVIGLDRIVGRNDDEFISTPAAENAAREEVEAMTGAAR